MQRFRRSVAWLMATILLLLPMQSALALRGPFSWGDGEKQEALAKRDQSEHWRTYLPGWHDRNLAWTTLTYDSERYDYLSVLCVAPPPAGLSAITYKVLLGPASIGLGSLETINYQRPTLPQPPGPLSHQDPTDPMWERWNDLYQAIGGLGSAPNPPVTTTYTREPWTVGIRYRDGSYWSPDFNEAGWAIAARAGFGPNCAVVDIDSGIPRGPQTITLAPPHESSLYIDAAKQVRYEEALKRYPPVTVTIPGYDDGMPAHRQVVDAYVDMPVQYKVTLQADTSAFRPGVPLSLYLKVEHTAGVPYCPVPIGITLPEWWSVKDGQGAEEDALTNGRNLWWLVELKPDQPAERWITVVPGEPPEGVAQVDLLGGLDLPPWPGQNAVNTTLRLPLAGGAHPVEAVALPPRKTPTDNMPPGGCKNGADPERPAPERIKLEANPPVLRSQDGYKSQVTARLVDLPGKPAAQGAPLTLTVSAPGKLTGVGAKGTTAAATLAIDPDDAQTKSDVMITATSADGYRSFLILPVGGLWLMGQVRYRPGDGSEAPVAGARVTAKEADGDRVYTGTTGENGWYMIRLKEARKLQVSVDAPGYLPADLKEPVAAPGEDDTAKAPPVYLVARSSLDLARRRAAQIQSFHKPLTPGDGLATAAGAPFAASVPDPTAPGGQIEAWLDMVERDRTPPREREEALRRLNLALEIAVTAGRDAKGFADDWAAALWDDGIMGVMDLYKSVKGVGMAAGLQAQFSPEPNLTKLEELMNKEINPLSNKLGESLNKVLTQAIAAMADGAGKGSAYFPKPEKAKELADYLLGLIVERTRKEVDKAYRPDDPAQKLAVDVATGKLNDGLQRELKEVVSDWFAMGYLDMVNTELATAVTRATKGQFEPDGYLAAEMETRYRMATLNATRNGVGNTPADEAIKTFVEGSTRDFKGWGYAAIAAVTAGEAIPALDKAVMAMDFGAALLKAQRFVKGVALFNQTLNPGSDWWAAVEGGIRIAFDAKLSALQQPAAPAAKSVALTPGVAAMLVGGERKEIDAAPFVAEGRTMVPVRAAAEALGAQLTWDPATQQVTMSRNGHAVTMAIGKPQAQVDGGARAIDPNNSAVVPLLKDGRTFVPIRFLAESLGASLQWDAKTNATTLTVD